MSKETYKYVKTDVQICQKRLTFTFYYAHARLWWRSGNTKMSRDLQICQKRPTNMSQKKCQKRHVYMKRASGKRPTYMKRDLHICQKRHSKETNKTVRRDTYEKTRQI